ncbi:TPA: hypothetical protein QDB07_000792 [Burkholderia vietnamiensis]|uniref:hypothetical protein n=1 Tax=Burkholderia glumae TaxID=337 RepID=UPI00214FDB9F|nr:hypothetical protein [Burkholderia glumae]HDR9033343.1 hypothetical protein [Burkholderia vietnamiensis]
MSTFTLEAPVAPAFDAAQEPVELTLSHMLLGAIGEADLQQIQRLIRNLGIDLSDRTTHPVGIQLPFEVIKAMGRRDTVEQHQALKWFFDNGLFDRNYNLKELVERMIAAGVGVRIRFGVVTGSFTGSTH